MFLGLSCPKDQPPASVESSVEPAAVAPVEAEPVDVPPLPAQALQADPLDRETSFRFEHASIEDVCSTLTNLTGVNVAASPGVTQYARLHQLKVHLQADAMPVRGALDWLVRQLDAQYVIVPEFGVLIARDYEYLAGEKLIRRTYVMHTAVRIDRPMRGAYDIAGERGALIDIAEQCLRVPERYCPGSGLRVGLRDDLLLVTGPARSHEIMQQIMDEVARGDQFDPPPLPSLQDGLRAQLEKKLGEAVVCRFEEQPLMDSLRDLTKQARVNVGFDPRNLSAQVPEKIAFDIGEVPLSEALRQLAGRIGLGEMHLEPGRGVWLRGANDADTWLDTGEFFWSRAVVRSYYVKPIVARVGAARLIDSVQKHVTPGRWGGLGAAAAYHPAGRLIVFHDPNGQQQVARYLAAGLQLPAEPQEQP